MDFESVPITEILDRPIEKERLKGVESVKKSGPWAVRVRTPRRALRFSAGDHSGPWQADYAARLWRNLPLEDV